MRRLAPRYGFDILLPGPLTPGLCIMQMPLTLSDAEIRRLRDHEVLLTHVGITTLTSEEFRASADRIVKKFSQITTQNIPKLNSEVGFKVL